jgi:putative ABC transport system substrate-binding protein
MAADLIRRQAVITAPNTPSALAAKAATTTIPIVFLTAADPVALGLIASLNRPGGNATGVASLNTEIAVNRLGIIRELAPQTVRYFALVNPTSALADPFIKDLEAGAANLGIQVEILNASTAAEIGNCASAYRWKPAKKSRPMELNKLGDALIHIGLDRLLSLAGT